MSMRKRIKKNRRSESVGPKTTDVAAGAVVVVRMKLRLNLQVAVALTMRMRMRSSCEKRGASKVVLIFASAPLLPNLCTVEQKEVTFVFVSPSLSR